MIARLRGTLVERDIDRAVVDCGGVGYDVRLSLRDTSAMPPVGETVTLHVHTDVREDAIVLFGFVAAGDRLMFERLTTVKGIGPKLAMAALGAMTARELQGAIVAGDVRALSRIPGIGHKTAQRIVLELGERVAHLDLGAAAAGTAPAASSVLGDVALALAGLGYTRAQVDAVMQPLRARADAGEPAEKLLKEALGLLRS